MTGFPVGAEAPPSSSTVTATTEPSRTLPSTGIATVPPGRREEPAGDRITAVDHPDLVRLARRRLWDVRDDEHGVAVRADDEPSGRAGQRGLGGRVREHRAAVRSRASAERASSSSEETDAPQMPRASAAQAATAAAAPSTGVSRDGAARRGRRRSAAPRARRRGCGHGAPVAAPAPTVAVAIAAATSVSERSSSRASSDVARSLFGARAIRLVECVERVGGDQLVSLGVHDPSDSASSRTSRSRARPANILLLIVPRGTPSLSASSDCE